MSSWAAPIVVSAILSYILEDPFTLDICGEHQSGEQWRKKNDEVLKFRTINKIFHEQSSKHLIVHITPHSIEKLKHVFTAKCLGLLVISTADGMGQKMSKFGTPFIIGLALSVFFPLPSSSLTFPQGYQKLMLCCGSDRHPDSSNSRVVDSSDSILREYDRMMTSGDGVLEGIIAPSGERAIAVAETQDPASGATTDPALNETIINNYSELLSAVGVISPLLTKLHFNRSNLNKLDIPANMTNLQSVTITMCDYLESVEDVNVNFEELVIDRCRGLMNCRLGETTNIQKLSIDSCGISKLSVNDVVQLKELVLSQCYSLSAVSLEGAVNLRKLDIDGCRYLNKITLPLDVRSLEEVNIVKCRYLEEFDIKSAASDLPSQLSKLVVNDCEALKVLTVPFDAHLKEVKIDLCPSLKGLDLVSMSSIRSLMIQGFGEAQVRLPDVWNNLLDLDLQVTKYSSRIIDLSSALNLHKFKMSDCKDCKDITLLLPHQLADVDIAGSNNVASLDLSKLKNLSSLSLDDISGFQLPINLQKLSHVSLVNCADLVTIDLTSSELLSTLHIGYCEMLKGITLPEKGLCIHDVKIRDCNALTKIDLSQRFNLTCLMVWSCKSLNSLLLPASLSQLRKVGLELCPCVESLDLSGAAKLDSLNIWKCEGLQQVVMPRESSLKTIVIDSCAALSELDISLCVHLHKLKLYNLRKIDTLELPISSDLAFVEIEDCDFQKLCNGSSDNDFIYTSQKNLTVSECVSKIPRSTSKITTSTTVNAILSNLFILKLSRCRLLKCLAWPMSGEVGVTVGVVIDICSCNDLHTLDLSKTNHLKKLRLLTNRSLSQMHLPECLDHLQYLNVMSCTKLTSLAVPTAYNLRQMRIHNCPLKEIEVNECLDPKANPSYLKAIYQTSDEPQLEVDPHILFICHISSQKTINVPGSSTCATADSSPIKKRRMLR